MQMKLQPQHLATSAFIAIQFRAEKVQNSFLIIKGQRPKDKDQRLKTKDCRFCDFPEGKIQDYAFFMASISFLICQI